MDSKITNSGISVPTQAVTTADGLTVNSVIVPVVQYFSFPIFVTDLSKTIFTAVEAFQVTSVRAVFEVASVSGAITVEKLTGTTAPGGGTAMLTGTLSLVGTADAVLSGALTATTSVLQLAAGNRIGIVLSGTLTSLIGAVVTIGLKRI